MLSLYFTTLNRLLLRIMHFTILVLTSLLSSQHCFHKQQCLIKKWSFYNFKRYKLCTQNILTFYANGQMWILNRGFYNICREIHVKSILMLFLNNLFSLFCYYYTNSNNLSTSTQSTLGLGDFNKLNSISKTHEKVIVSTGNPKITVSKVYFDSLI